MDFAAFELDRRKTFSCDGKVRMSYLSKVEMSY